MSRAAVRDDLSAAAECSIPEARSAAPVAAPELAPLLRAGSHGTPGVEAAIGLLDAHGVWIQSMDFRCAAVTLNSPDGQEPARAVVDFEAAAVLADTATCSAADRQVLLIACSLGGVDVDNLAHLCAGLDQRTLALVLDAVAHAAGWHATGVSHLVTGRVGQTMADSRPTGALSVAYPSPTDLGLRGLTKVLYRAAVQAAHHFGHPAAAYAWLAGYEQRCNISELAVVAAARRSLPDGPRFPSPRATPA